MKKIINIKAGRNIKLSDYGLIAVDINKIWTIYDEDEMWDYCKFNPDNGMKVERDNLESLKPFHHHGVFLEQKLHDWNVDEKENLLHYGSRIVEQGKNVKVLVEYEQMKCKNCPNWCDSYKFNESFCGITGQSKGSNSYCTSSEKNVFDHGTVYDR